MVGSVKRASAIGKRRVLGGVFFCRDCIEKPEDRHEDQNGETG